MKKIIPLLLLHCFGFKAINAQIKLPALVRDSMILQRDTKVNIWGWAAPGEHISASFNGKKYQTKANIEGKWLFQLY